MVNFLVEEEIHDIVRSSGTLIEVKIKDLTKSVILAKYRLFDAP